MLYSHGTTAGLSVKNRALTIFTFVCQRRIKLWPPGTVLCDVYVNVGGAGWYVMGLRNLLVKKNCTTAVAILLEVVLLIT